MVDLVSLGEIAAAVVAKLSETAVDRATDGVVDAGVVAVGTMVAWLRGKLSSGKELEAVEEYPDSTTARQRLAEVIDAEIVADKDKAHLQTLIDRVKVEAPLVYQNAVGNNIVQAYHSTVQVNWPPRPAATD